MADPLPITPASDGSVRTELAVAHHDTILMREIVSLKHRTVREATNAIGMLESALDALFRLDPDAARHVVERDDEIDAEEVDIEESLFRLLSLHQPFARDFRAILTLVKVNADIERAADHAKTIGKLAIRLCDLGVPVWPTALQELGQRVPILCHSLLNALQREDVDTAGSVLARDKLIDNLDKRLFDEALDLMGDDRDSRAVGMLLYRCGRELERVGDLMTNIAEDIIYLVTGSIVRHRRKRDRQGPPPP